MSIARTCQTEVFRGPYSVTTREAFVASVCKRTGTRTHFRFTCVKPDTSMTCLGAMCSLALKPCDARHERIRLSKRLRVHKRRPDRMFLIRCFTHQDVFAFASVRLGKAGVRLTQTQPSHGICETVDRLCYPLQNIHIAEPRF